MKIYHGTDLRIANEIRLSNHFAIKDSREHWLGNGIYFFIDKKLAEWWTTRPSNKFGNDVFTPAIIECEVETNSNNTLDLFKHKRGRL